MKKIILFIGIISLSVLANATDVTYLAVTSVRNLTSSNNELLDAPKVFKVDAAFVAKYAEPQFYMFIFHDEFPNICFVGNPEVALTIVDEILSVTTGDAFVYPSKKAVANDQKVSRAFRYDDEGGVHFKTANVPACK